MRTFLGSVFLGLLLTIAPSLVSAADRFLYSYNASRAANMIYSGPYQFNGEADDTVRTERLSTGRYRVFLAQTELAEFGGNVQISSYGEDISLCSVVGWNQDGVNVACFDLDGRAKDSQFSTLVTTPGNTPGISSYVYASRQTSGSYRPISQYSHLPGGGEYSISRISEGEYAVSSSSNMQFNKGIVLVTPYGTDATLCAASLTSEENRVIVSCVDHRGSRKDSRFSLLHVGLSTDSFVTSTNAADTVSIYQTNHIAIASVPANIPNLTFAENSFAPTGGHIEIGRPSNGVYEVYVGALTDIPGAGVQVHSRVQSAHCWARNWFRGLVTVECIDLLGNAVLAPFDVFVVRGFITNPALVDSNDNSSDTIVISAWDYYCRMAVYRNILDRSINYEMLSQQAGPDAASARARFWLKSQYQVCERARPDSQFFIDARDMLKTVTDGLERQLAIDDLPFTISYLRNLKAFNIANFREHCGEWEEIAKNQIIVGSHDQFLSAMGAMVTAPCIDDTRTPSGGGAPVTQPGTYSIPALLGNGLSRSIRQCIQPMLPSDACTSPLTQGPVDGPEPDPEDDSDQSVDDESQWTNDGDAGNGEDMWSRTIRDENGNAYYEFELRSRTGPSVTRTSVEIICCSPPDRREIPYEPDWIDNIGHPLIDTVAVGLEAQNTYHSVETDLAAGRGRYSRGAGFGPPGSVSASIINELLEFAELPLSALRTLVANRLRSSSEDLTFSDGLFLYLGAVMVNADHSDGDVAGRRAMWDSVFGSGSNYCPSFLGNETSVAFVDQADGSQVDVLDAVNGCFCQALSETTSSSGLSRRNAFCRSDRLDAVLDCFQNPFDENDKPKAVCVDMLLSSNPGSMGEAIGRKYCERVQCPGQVSSTADWSSGALACQCLFDDRGGSPTGLSPASLRQCQQITCPEGVPKVTNGLGCSCAPRPILEVPTIRPPLDLPDLPLE
ncbi:hypothetical protein SAMN05444273_1143 [Litoreibacter ascidiaceicola]|uniref:Uncharacterized protein n=1 Tax=Litoreibacter ascidiaceicola TaxID=1486859 RepID=A0A1M5ESX9_9RHOB|nr:hypothetical protein [Litoreibacter ascidiaceicola]SHF82240.1 hypothetical protein SAMN05444273_1143 [Litoreibacter ascidiaceicola]